VFLVSSVVKNFFAAAIRQDREATGRPKISGPVPDCFLSMAAVW